MNEFNTHSQKFGLDNAEAQILFEAFTHKSFAHESKFDLSNNERLEFLGDSVLQLVVSEKLIKAHPGEKEGKLSKLRSSIVNENSLSELGKYIGVNKLILLGKGELLERGHNKNSLIANCFEAYLGALYVSNGYESAKNTILNIFETYAQENKDLFAIEAIENFDAKSRLQEKLMKIYKELPKYEANEIEGDKEKLFTIKVNVAGRVLGEITHKSKKKGMQALAKKILKKMEDNNSQENSNVN